MFTAIMAAFSFSNPLAAAKNIFFTVLIAAAVGSLGFLVHHYRVDAVTIDKLKVEKQVVVDANVELAKQVKANEESRVIDTAAETTNVVEAKKTDVKHSAAVAKVEEKVKEIKEDPKITVDQKPIEISKDYIADLWSGYCKASDNADANCLTAPVTTSPSSMLDLNSVDNVAFEPILSAPMLDTSNTADLSYA